MSNLFEFDAPQFLDFSVHTTDNCNKELLNNLENGFCCTTGSPVLGEINDTRDKPRRSSTGSCVKKHEPVPEISKNLLALQLSGSKNLLTLKKSARSSARKENVSPQHGTSSQRPDSSLLRSLKKLELSVRKQASPALLGNIANNTKQHISDKQTGAAGVPVIFKPLPKPRNLRKCLFLKAEQQTCTKSETSSKSKNLKKESGAHVGLLQTNDKVKTSSLKAQRPAVAPKLPLRASQKSAKN